MVAARVRAFHPGRAGRCLGVACACLLWFFSASVAAAGPASAVPSASPAPAHPIRVGVAGSVPFVVEEQGRLDGLSLELFRLVAERLDLAYELQRVESVDGGISQLASGRLDALIGPISITAARARQVGFTQPYFRSALAIATRDEDTSLWQRVGPFLSEAFWLGASSLLLVLGLVGTSIWFAERKHNAAMFPASPLRGIGNGIWMALVTMTTVGYGDRVPVTLTGRVIAGVWMVIAMLSVSSLTAGIATTLTLAQLDHGRVERAEQLAGLRVGVVRDTVGANFARRQRASVRPVSSLQEALKLLEQGKLDAVVHDRPILLYELGQANGPKLFLSPAVSSAQGYGFAVEKGAALADSLSIALLKAREGGEVAELSSKWLAED